MVKRIDIMYIIEQINKILYIVSNDEMLNYVNDNYDEIILQNYLIVSIKNFKGKFNEQIKKLIFGPLDSTLFNILDNPKINWSIVAKLKEEEHSKINEYITFFGIKKYNIEEI